MKSHHGKQGSQKFLIYFLVNEWCTRSDLTDMRRVRCIVSNSETRGEIKMRSSDDVRCEDLHSIDDVIDLSSVTRLSWWQGRNEQRTRREQDDWFAVVVTIWKALDRRSTSSKRLRRGECETVEDTRRLSCDWLDSSSFETVERSSVWSLSDLIFFDPFGLPKFSLCFRLSEISRFQTFTQLT